MPRASASSSLEVMESSDFERLNVPGGALEYVAVGTGEPVVLIHGAFIAEAYAPFCREPAVADHRLVRYHRRGYAGSSDVTPPSSIADQAADCVALMRGLGIERAHLVGHSSGGVIALQVALDAPEMVHSLVLLEAGLLDVPSGPPLFERLGPAIQLYAAGKKAEAVDAFLSVVLGPAYRSHLDALIPGGFEQAVADADAFFGVELASLGEWRLAQEDARRITQPILAVFGADSVHDWVGWPEVQARVASWMPQAEVFVLTGANHMLQEKDPRGVAEAMAPFLASHPMPMRVRSG